MLLNGIEAVDATCAGAAASKRKEATQDTWAASMLADQSCRLTAGYTQPVLR
jgi:hypothetical protein